MAFNPNIPQPLDFQDDSQSILLTNNQQLDTSFGVDHYKFSDMTANNGFHNKVTTPAYVENPTTGLPPITTTNPILYAFQQTANIGVLQYSRGSNDSVPTPITNLKSSATPITLTASGTTNVLDFTGISISSFLFTAFDSQTLNLISLYWGYYSSTATNRFALQTAASNGLRLTSSGNILILQNFFGLTLSNVYWDLQFIRIQ
jgi:hypothetical protein